MKFSFRKAVQFLSFVAFPITLNYFSPYVIYMAAGEGIINGSFIIFGLLLLTAVFFGRAFCSYICPAGAAQDYMCGVNGKPSKGGWRNIVKYVVWVPWILGIAATAYTAGGYKGINPLFSTESGISVDEPSRYIIYFGILLIIIIMSFVIGKRAACHSICWMAPFMVIGGWLGRVLRLPHLHLKAENNNCIDCMKCSRNCPMSIDVHSHVKSGNMHDNECILCGDCARGCEKKTISRHFGIDGRKR